MNIQSNGESWINRVLSNGTGIILTITIPLLVFAWHLTALAKRPPHLNEIVSKLGPETVGHFVFLMPDHTDMRLVYIQGIETGYGLFLYKIHGGKRKLLDEDSYTKPGPLHQMLFSWSPDDRFFAYCRHNTSWEIVICDGDTGAAVTTVPVNDRVTLGAWLSPQSLALVDDVHRLFSVQQSQEKWSGLLPFKHFKLPTESVQDFAAFDSNSIVWKQGNTIWRCGKDSDAPVKVWDSKTIKLIHFSYSQAANRFLLHCQDTNGQFLADFYPNRSDELSFITRINTNEYHPEDLRLINNGKGYAFISQIGITNLMVTKFDDSHPPVRYRWPAQYARFVPGQHEVFIETSLTHGPTGILKYDMLSGSVECVVPRADNLYYLTNGTVEWNQVTNPSGETLTYYLYAPPHQSVPQKHSLIMGVTGIGYPGFAWNSEFQPFADCGYYFMYVERYNRDDTQLSQDVLTIYKSLMKNPDIDTNSVYLYGSSEGARSVCSVLEKYPKLWQGIILHSPTQLPDPSQLSEKRVFIDFGANDSVITNGSLNLTRFQDKASSVGVPVTLLVHPGEDHILRMPSSQRERLRETLIFLNEP